MIAAIYARKSTEQTGVADEQKAKSKKFCARTMRSDRHTLRTLFFGLVAMW
jgi:hypothetical protein